MHFSWEGRNTVVTRPVDWLWLVRARTMCLGSGYKHKVPKCCNPQFYPPKTKMGINAFSMGICLGKCLTHNISTKTKHSASLSTTATFSSLSVWQICSCMTVVVANWKFIFHTVVLWCDSGVIGSFMITLLQISWRVSVKELWKFVNISWSYDTNTVVYVFDSQCSCCTRIHQSTQMMKETDACLMSWSLRQAKLAGDMIEYFCFDRYQGMYNEQWTADLETVPSCWQSMLVCHDNLRHVHLLSWVTMLFCCARCHWLLL